MKKEPASSSRLTSDSTVPFMPICNMRLKIRKCLQNLKLWKERSPLRKRVKTSKRSANAMRRL